MFSLFEVDGLISPQFLCCLHMVVASLPSLHLEDSECGMNCLVLEEVGACDEKTKE